MQILAGVSLVGTEEVADGLRCHPVRLQVSRQAPGVYRLARMSAQGASSRLISIFKMSTVASASASPKICFKSDSSRIPKPGESLLSLRNQFHSSNTSAVRPIAAGRVGYGKKRLPHIGIPILDTHGHFRPGVGQGVTDGGSPYR